MRTFFKNSQIYNATSNNGHNLPKTYTTCRHNITPALRDVGPTPCYPLSQLANRSNNSVEWGTAGDLDPCVGLAWDNPKHHRPGIDVPASAHRRANARGRWPAGGQTLAESPLAFNEWIMTGDATTPSDVYRGWRQCYCGPPILMWILIENRVSHIVNPCSTTGMFHSTAWFHVVFKPNVFFINFFKNQASTVAVKGVVCISVNIVTYLFSIFSIQ